jgi:hypothetical protein
MTPFEEQLKQAMARREPSPDFTARVLARAAREQLQATESGRWGWFPRRRAWRLAGAMAALLVMSGSALYQQHDRVVRGKAAKEKLLVAVRIAGLKLRQAHRQVLETEEDLNQ